MNPISRACHLLSSSCPLNFFIDSFFKGKNCTLKVLLGSLLIMKAGLVNGVHVFEGSTIVDTASSATDDNTHLWHLTLGHKSERGLNELSIHELCVETKFRN